MRPYETRSVGPHLVEVTAKLNHHHVRVCSKVPVPHYNLCTPVQLVPRTVGRDAKVCVQDRVVCDALADFVAGIW
jgi:hypothetical protein